MSGQFAADTVICRGRVSSHASLTLSSVHPRFYRNLLFLDEQGPTLQRKWRLQVADWLDVWIGWTGGEFACYRGRLAAYRLQAALADEDPWS